MRFQMHLDLVALGNAALILGAFALFAAIHSLTAGRGLKLWLARFLSPRLVAAWYRLLYNTVSMLTLIPVLALVMLLPDRPLYALAAPWSVICLMIQAVGLGGFAASLLATDLWRFAGISQVLEYLSGKASVSSHVPLKLDGPYRLVRHPLYLFSLLIIWPLPSTTWNLLWFDIGVTAYFAVGSLVEERRLEHEYGDAYRKYRQQG